MTTPRRGFLRTLAAVPLAPAVVGPQAVPAPAPAPPPAPAPTPPTGHEAVAEALAEVAKREFGAPFDSADLAALRKELVRGLDSANRLRRAAALRNSDGPVNLFEARPPAPAGRGDRR